ITKKTKVHGFNGSFAARGWHGKKANTRESLNLNYLNDNGRVFGNIGYGHNQYVHDLYIFRHFKNDDGTTQSFFDQNSYLTGKIDSLNGRAGMDYYASEITTFGMNISGMSRAQSTNSDVDSQLSNPAYVLDSTIVADN